MALANDDVQTTEDVVSDDSSASLSDADVQRIREVTDAQTVTLQTSLDDGLKSYGDSVDTTIREVVPVEVTKALEDSSGTAQTVSIDAEQWQTITEHVQYVHDSYALQNALLLFAVMLCAAGIGMRFFNEFSRGFRRG